MAVIEQGTVRVSERTHHLLTERGQSPVRSTQPTAFHRDWTLNYGCETHYTCPVLFYGTLSMLKHFLLSFISNISSDKSSLLPHNVHVVQANKLWENPRGNNPYQQASESCFRHQMGQQIRIPQYIAYPEFWLPGRYAGRVSIATVCWTRCLAQENKDYTNTVLDLQGPWKFCRCGHWAHAVVELQTKSQNRVHQKLVVDKTTKSWCIPLQKLIHG